MDLKIALVHEWMVAMGEREKVIQAYLELFPKADLFTLVYRPEKMDPMFQKRRVTTSFLQRLPFGKTRPRWYLPLFWGAMRSLDLTGYDLVISLSAVCAKWVKAPEQAQHVCFFEGSLLNEEDGADFPRWQIRWFGNFIRRCEEESNRGVTHFLAGSESGKIRIRRLYGRDAEVIAPPLDALSLFKTQLYFQRILGNQPEK